jgi:transposase
MAVIEQTLEGKFNNHQAAQLLGLSIRQVKRLKNKAKMEGGSCCFTWNMAVMA